MDSVDTSRLVICTCRFPKLSDQSGSVFSPFPIFLNGWIICSSRFPMMKDVALGELGRQLVSQFLFLLSKGHMRNAPVLVWWNSCTSCPSIIFRVFSTTFGKWKEKIYKLTIVHSSHPPKKRWNGKWVTVGRIRTSKGPLMYNKSIYQNLGRK